MTDFSEETALAEMLAAGVIFLNKHWWRLDWPAEARQTIALCVNCNDTFGYACADAEGASFDDIEHLYEMWRKDPEYGAIAWCIQRRRTRPIVEVEKAIRKARIWDIKQLLKGRQPVLASNAPDSKEREDG
jgi:hypothetical protein